MASGNVDDVDPHSPAIERAPSQDSVTTMVTEPVVPSEDEYSSRRSRWLAIRYVRCLAAAQGPADFLWQGTSL